MANRDPGSVEVDVAELERCADTSAQHMVDAMQRVTADWAGATASPGSRLLPLNLLVDDVYRAQQQASEKMAETQRRLREVATAYREADRFPGS